MINTRISNAVIKIELAEIHLLKKDMFNIDEVSTKVFNGRLRYETLDPYTPSNSFENVSEVITLLDTFRQNATDEFFTYWLKHTIYNTNPTIKEDTDLRHDLKGISMETRSIRNKNMIDTLQQWEIDYPKMKLDNFDQVLSAHQDISDENMLKINQYLSQFMFKDAKISTSIKLNKVSTGDFSYDDGGSTIYCVENGNIKNEGSAVLWWLSKYILAPIRFTKNYNTLRVVNPVNDSAIDINISFLNNLRPDIPVKEDRIILHWANWVTNA